MKILFIHGLASSGTFKTATSLHHLLRPCEVIAPDVPIDPDEAFELLHSICDTAKPDLIVGLSMGGFWAQKMRGFPKILINPDFHISQLMGTMIGEVRYLSPRRNGDISFHITESLCSRYRELELVQFDGLDSREIELTKGMFATGDEMVDCFDEFNSLYPEQAVRYPGGHLPTHPELKRYLLPIASELLAGNTGICL